MLRVRRVGLLTLRCSRLPVLWREGRHRQNPRARSGEEKGRKEEEKGRREEEGSAGDVGVSGSVEVRGKEEKKRRGLEAGEGGLYTRSGPLPSSRPRAALAEQVSELLST